MDADRMNRRSFLGRGSLAASFVKSAGFRNLRAAARVDSCGAFVETTDGKIRLRPQA